jgi:6-phosphogluconolactonase
VTRLTTCADAESAAVRAASVLARQLDQARHERGVAHLALSGGSTPARTYRLLADAIASWDGVEIWFADERCVAAEDEESNYRLAREALLDPAAIPPEQVHRMEGELGPDEGAQRYADLLGERVAGSRSGENDALPALDVILLGIGPDGHVASLFPGAPILDADPELLCLGVSDSPKPPPRRITLTLSVLRAARSCVLLATGAAKADAVDAMLGEPTRHVPASLLRRERLTVILDDDAAPAGPHR